MRQHRRWIPLLLAAAAVVRAQTGTPLLPADATPQFRLQGLGADNWTVADVTGQPFSRLWRLRTPYAAGTGNAYDFTLTGRALQGIRQGDLLVATVWVRSVSAVYGQAHTRFVVQEDQPPYLKSAEWFLSAGKEWERFQIPFRAAKTNAPDGFSIQFWVGMGPQEIELAGLEVVNYGPQARISALGLADYPYAGFKNKGWRAEAERRIESLRKGDGVLVLRDAAGKPVAGAAVEIRMKSHQFGFGTAVQSELLLSDGVAAESYRRTLVENFNRATPENDLKWTEWSANPARALRGLEWLRANGFRQVRGHNLVWPDWQYLPAALRGFAGSPSGLQAEIDRHIATTVAATAGQVSEWDVLNEPVTNTALQKILGPEAMAAWFRTARAADPVARLYVNDYNLLEAGGGDTPHQAGLETVLQTLKDAPVDGIGLQAHMQGQLTDPARLYEVLTRFGAYRRQLQITELDIDVEDEALQAAYLEDLLTVAFSHPALSGVTLWGFWEGAHFRPNAALWRADWTPKPAATVWRELVMGKWRTRLQTRTDADGMARFRGFGGSYEAVVTVDGVERVLPFALTAGQNNYVFLGEAKSPRVAATGVVNGASFAAGPVSPGQIVAVFGTDFGGSSMARAAAEPGGGLPSAVGDVSLLVDGQPAGMLYAVAGQAGAVLPSGIRGITRLQLGFLGQAGNEVYLPVADANPGVFAVSGGSGQAVAFNAASGDANGPGSPVGRGTVLTLFATGMGEAGGDGAPLARPRVLIGEREAEVLSAGWIQPGIFQLNARVPPTAPAGDAVPVTVWAGPFRSQAGVTVAIR